MSSELLKNANFYAQFTGFIVTWNNCELLAREMFRRMLGDTQMAWAVSADIGNRTMLDAIISGSRDEKYRVFREEITHFCKGYELILGYRNYYVHSLGKIAEGSGELLCLVGKKRVKFHNENVTADDLNKMMNYTHELAAYAAGILTKLGSKRKGHAGLAASLGSSHGKPVWPDTLTRVPRYIQDQ